MKKRYKSITSVGILTAGLFTLMGFLGGCAEPHEKAEVWYNMPQGEKQAIMVLGEKDFKSINEKIVMPLEMIRDFESYCNISLPKTIQEVRRESAKKDALENIAQKSSVSCTPLKKGIDCEVLYDTPVPENPDEKIVIGHVYVNPSSEKIFDSKIMDSSPIKKAVNQAIKDNYLSEPEKECREKIFFEKGVENAKGLAGKFWKGAKDLYGSVKPAVEDAVKSAGEKYNSFADCLEEKGDPKYCIGLRDNN